MPATDKVERAAKGKGLSLRHVFKLPGRKSRSGTTSSLLVAHGSEPAATSDTDTQLSVQQRLALSPAPSNLSAISTDQSSQLQQLDQDIPDTALQITKIISHDVQNVAGSESDQIVSATESLWDQAYNKLRDDDVQLLNKYEVLLKQQLLSSKSQCLSNRRQLISFQQLLIQFLKLLALAVKERVYWIHHNVESNSMKLQCRD